MLLLLHASDRQAGPGPCQDAQQAALGHLRAMPRKHRLVYLNLVSHFIMHQQCQTRRLDVRSNLKS